MSVCLDEEDEWFYESIKRYNTLKTYDFATTVQQIEFTDSTSICLAFTEKLGQNEILNLALPKKLTVPPSQQGLVKDTDLKMICGGFSLRPLVQIQPLIGKNTILTSERDQYGLSVYKMQPENTGKISSTGTLNTDHKSPKMTHNKTDTLALATTNKQSFALLDTSTSFQVKGDGCCEEESREHELCPSFLSSHLLGLCNVETGITSLHDIRDKNQSSKTDYSHPSQWALSSSFLSSAQNGDNNDETKLGLISSEGMICIYDLRRFQCPLNCVTIDKDLKQKDTKIFRSKPTLRFCPENSSQISVSGFNSKVEILDFSTGEMKNVFVHDGHVTRKNESSENLVTDHIWYKNLIISACDNLSVHCWEYAKK